MNRIAGDIIIGTMMTFALMCMGLLGGTEVWTQSSHVKVFPDAEPGRHAAREVELYAARGEQESFQVCIRSDEKELSGVQVQGGGMKGLIGPPEVRRVGFLQFQGNSPRAMAPLSTWPDPLLDFEPFNVPPRTTCILWVRYAIPPGINAGKYHGTLRLSWDGGSKRKVPVTLHVFDFDIPEVSSLRGVFSLNRASIRSVYGIGDGPLSEWKPIYDALAGYRLSYGLWDDGDVVRINATGLADASVLKEQLDYAAAAARMSAINIGPNGGGLAVFPGPGAGATIDPLQIYLRDMVAWLEPRGLVSRAFVEPSGVAARSQWMEALEAHARVARTERRIARLLVSDLNPILEESTEIWAVPLESAYPLAAERLREGFSLAAPVAYPAQGITASSSRRESASGLGGCRPEDAYDGCFFTVWWPAREPQPSKPEWVRVDFESAVRSRNVSVVWKSGFDVAQVRVTTSHDGSAFNVADVAWNHHPPADPVDFGWSEGEFKTEKSIRSLRLEFRAGDSTRLVGIGEITLAEPQTSEAVPRIAPVEVWLWMMRGVFPSLAADAHPVEPRLLPWVCWTHNLGGFTGAALNAWPAAWKELAAEQPLTWAGGGVGEGFLFYPGRHAPIPSIRAELLRDGLEDYEYLSALGQAIGLREIEESAAYRWYLGWGFTPDMPRQGLDGLANHIGKARVEIGRALTELARRKR